MLVRCRVLLVACLLLAVVLPVSAAERVDTLPPIRPTTKARFDLAVLINGEQFVVGKGAIASPTRAYFVLRSLAVAGAPEQTLEIVTFDGATYVREGTNPQFVRVSSDALPFTPPTADLVSEAAPLGQISKIDTVSIAGTPTDQYQIWINDIPEGVDEATGMEGGSMGYAKVDMFIGQQVNYLYQLQFSLFGMESGEEMSIETVSRFYDFDDPSIVVNPPMNVASRANGSAGLVNQLRTGGLLQTMSAPLATPQLRALVMERLAR